MTIYGYVTSDNNIVNCIFSYIKYFFFVGRLYNSYHLWYLLAMIYALLAMWILIHHGKSTPYLLMTGAFFYLIYLVFAWIRQGEEASGLLAGAGRAFDFVFNNGGVFTGLLYMSIGIFFREHRRLTPANCDAHRTESIFQTRSSVAGIVAGILIKYGLSQEMGNILAAVMFFALVLNIRLRDSKGYILLRNLSKYIYLLHLLCFSLYTFVIIRQPNKLGVDSFIATFAMAVLFSAAIIYGKELIKIKKKSSKSGKIGRAHV